MPENGLTIHHKGRSYDIDLTESDADDISDLAYILDYAPRDPEPQAFSTFPEAEIRKRTARSAQYEKIAVDFQEQLRRIANLDKYQMAKLIAFLDLIELGDIGRNAETNWALEFINDLLAEAMCSGPAGLLHRDPRGFLAGLAKNLYGYWWQVKSIRDSVARHPEIFPPSPAASEPEATATQPKPQRARKRGGKQAA